MEKNEEIFEKALEALRNEQIPSGPSKELAADTAAKLAEAAGGTENAETRMIRLLPVRNLARIAAAAVLLILAGYAAGRLSGPQPPDIEQLRAAIEPSIRQDLLDEINSNMLASLEKGYTQIKDELSRQYRQDLDRTAMQTLAASNTVTNQLLTKLIDSIKDSQLQERRLVAAALEQIESNRLRDRSQLSSAVAALAVQTEDELIRTKKDVAQALSYAVPESAIPLELENPHNPDERNEK